MIRNTATAIFGALLRSGRPVPGLIDHVCTLPRNELATLELDMARHPDTTPEHRAIVQTRLRDRQRPHAWAAWAGHAIRHGTPVTQAFDEMPEGVDVEPWMVVSAIAEAGEAHQDRAWSDLLASDDWTYLHAASRLAVDTHDALRAAAAVLAADIHLRGRSSPLPARALTDATTFWTGLLFSPPARVVQVLDRVHHPRFLLAGLDAVTWKLAPQHRGKLTSLFIERVLLPEVAGELAPHIRFRHLETRLWDWAAEWTCEQADTVAAFVENPPPGTAESSLAHLRRLVDHARGRLDAAASTAPAARTIGAMGNRFFDWFTQRVTASTPRDWASITALVDQLPYDTPLDQVVAVINGVHDAA
jgi:hypothetical protein